jgi:hypothetical protein
MPARTRPGKQSDRTRREAVRDLNKGHHMAPRQTVTGKRKSKDNRARRARDMH